LDIDLRQIASVQQLFGWEFIKDLSCRKLGKICSILIKYNLPYLHLGVYLQIWKSIHAGTGKMDIKEFISGSYEQQNQFKSFLPGTINRDWLISDSAVIQLLSEADIKLGELNAFSQLVPDINFFIAMHVSKEATTSSRIEGTQTNIAEALQKLENISPEKRDDWEEVQNYIKAINEAVALLDELPLSNRLLKKTHHTLLQGVRGKNRLPGEFRLSQNWIGGASPADAVFIPPSNDKLPDLMSDFEKFLNNEAIPLPHLIRIGIAHYQFETIHPFLDGNGRIGRLLVTLYLVSKGLLSKPTLYLSAFLEKNKSLYYDNLTRVRTHNDLTQWLKFFLEGVRQTAENSIQTFRSIIELREKYEKGLIPTLGRKTKSSLEFMHYLYSNPVVDSQQVARALSVNSSTALRMIEDFIALGILVETTGYKRNRIFAFDSYLKLFE
jgi:Fic family protein